MFGGQVIRATEKLDISFQLHEVRSKASSYFVCLEFQGYGHIAHLLDRRISYTCKDTSMRGSGRSLTLAAIVLKRTTCAYRRRPCNVRLEQVILQGT
jgi:hypothetical protein